MTSRFALPAALIAILLTAACSGGSGGPRSAVAPDGTSGGPSAPSMPAEPTFDELALQNQLHLRHDRGINSIRLAKPNLASMIPTRGRGAYTGTMALAADGDLYSGNGHSDFTPDRADLVANMALNVDFDTTRVDGALWDFVDREGFKQDGSVQLRGLRRSDRLEVAGTGTLYEQDGRQADLSVEFDTFFIGSDNALIRGNVTAELDRNGGVTPMTGDVVGSGRTY